MYILGISCYYHDSAAALIKDGKVVAAAEEERFTRKKHDNTFPINAIEYCLKSQSIDIKDVYSISFYEKPLLKFERVLYQLLATFPKSFKVFITSLPAWFNEKLRLRRAVKKKLKYKGDIYYIPHHVAHAASSFLVSPFSDSAIVTIDGVGEWTTTTFGVGKDEDIVLQKEIKFPHSLGLLYSTVTAYLGFSVNNSEYKVMGMAAYGNSDKKTNEYYKKLQQVIDVKDDGSFRLDMAYFDYHFSDHMPSKKFTQLFEGAIRKHGSKITQRHKDIAAAVQMIYEEVFFKILNHAQKITGKDNLVLSGGVIQNSLANGKILRQTNFKDVWISPNVTDGGTSIGAASYLYHSILGHPRIEVMKNSYLGPSHSRAEIKGFLDENNIKYSEHSPQNLIERTAELLQENKVIGWYQGRMEFGPRALGNRSILANPKNQEAKELLNQKVKHREKFRPFAPVVPADEVGKYFEVDASLLATDFMAMVYPVKKEFHDVIPSVVHEDGTGRLQTITREENKLYYNLLKEFEKLSGVPILINTSFNVRGEPIVCTPYDAYRCVMGTEIDYLIMDEFMIKRDDNLRDVWNSEAS